MGIPWDRPFSLTRDFVNGLQPLLAGQAAQVVGEQLTTRTKLAIDAPNTPILLAALGPRMLRFAGERVDGTTLGQCGPRTIATYVLPHLDAGAAAAGRERPRVMALVRICVTEDRRGAFALAQAISARYQAFPVVCAGAAARRPSRPGRSAPHWELATGSRRPGSVCRGRRE